ncbi:MAG: hypothetical protein K6U14_07920 [Firmicutes bacterium]|nr:hypothetical protein [Alicyclobacillaceae bacterium]MCL6497543.1 hypothetical protein [Bacillota bacterium]
MEATEFGEYVALVNRYMDEGYTDGLPVIPPSRDHIAAMVAASGRPADAVLGVIPPRNVPLTIETVAINAIMAGCLPEYMPVVVAALEAILQPGFNLVSPACSTKGVAPLFIVNGPIRKQIGLNALGNVFGPGFRANASIGRAVRLVMINAGGARSQALDKSTFGHPGKYTYVIAEDEEGSPWEPFHVERGFSPEESTVAAVACEAPRLVGNYNPEAGPEGILLTIADTLSTLTSFGATGPKDATVVLLGPEHRDTIAQAGWSKRDVQQFLFEHCGRRAGELKRTVGGVPAWGTVDAPDDAWVQMFADPDRILVVAAGGGAGRFSVVCDGFAAPQFCQWQMRKIEVPPSA